SGSQILAAGRPTRALRARFDTTERAALEQGQLLTIRGADLELVAGAHGGPARVTDVALAVVVVAEVGGSAGLHAHVAGAERVADLQLGPRARGLAGQRCRRVAGVGAAEAAGVADGLPAAAALRVALGRRRAVRVGVPGVAAAALQLRAVAAQRAVG